MPWCHWKHLDISNLSGALPGPLHCVAWRSLYHKHIVDFMWRLLSCHPAYEGKAASQEHSMHTFNFFAWCTPRNSNVTRASFLEDKKHLCATITTE